MKRDERRDGNIYITWDTGDVWEVYRIYMRAGELRERRWEPGWRARARSIRAPQARIHIQIELYALPDALIRNHSTAWYLQNKPVSSPSQPSRSPSVRSYRPRVSFRSAELSLLSWLMEILGEKLVKHNCFAYVSKHPMYRFIRLPAQFAQKIRIARLIRRFIWIVRFVNYILFALELNNSNGIDI